MKIMERKYVSKNGVVERTRYLVGDNAQPRRKRKKGNTTFRKQEANFNSAVRRVARILNCNYTHDNGLLLTLDYDAAGLEKLCGLAGLTPEETAWAMGRRQDSAGDWTTRGEKRKTEAESACDLLGKLREAAEKQMGLYLRRIRRAYGDKLKYIAVTADIDGETGELVRIHHHIPMEAEGISWDMLQKQWRMGSVDIRRLRQQADYTPVAVYLMRQVRRIPDAKKYAVSRGMELPEISEREILGNPEIKAPAGARVLERSAYSVESVAQYIRYVPRQRRGKDGVQGDSGSADAVPQAGEDLFYAGQLRRDAGDGKKED